MWVFVFVGVVAVAVAAWKIMEKPAVVEVAKEAPIMHRRAIDGVLVSQGTPESYPLAVVIENSIDAWPISGVAQANLVWEAPTEAGITRFLAIFADGRVVKEIGPVRSIRPYFIDWAEEAHALLAHVGGSPEALALAGSRAVIDLNEFWNGGYFWRASDRARPHNVYTSTDLLRASFGEEAVAPTYESWQYQDDAVREARGRAQEITVVFGNPVYTVTWQYDPETNDYVRSQRGAFYRDANGTIVRTKNLIIMQTEIQILDEIGRRKIKTVGNGLVQVFRDGQEIAGEWRRSSLAERTQFFDANGASIALNAGTTWISVTDHLPTVE